MRSPFASEATAFRFVVLTVAAFSIVLAAELLGGHRAAVPVWVAVSVATAAVYLHPRRRNRLRTAPAHVGPPGERRLIVVAQEPPPAQALEEIRDRADRVLVVSAATVPFLRRWTSDLDAAHEKARQRVETTVAELRNLNTPTQGLVGYDDTVQTLEDALRTFGGDEILLCPATDIHGDTLATRIHEQFALPVTRLSPTAAPPTG